MYDPRINKLANVIVNYSLDIKPGEHLLIRSNPLAEPLIKAVYKEAIKKRAYVTPMINLEGLDEIFFKHASKEQLEYVSPLNEYLIDNFDAFLSIGAEYNTKNLSGVDSEKIATLRRARSHLDTKFMEKAAKGELKWCYTEFPTHASAQEANMSLEEYQDFVFEAGLLDKEDPISHWKEIDKKQKKIIDYLETKSKLQIISKDTDLTMNISGRKWINCSGKENFPDGEIFTAPIEDSVQGHIRFNFPGIYAGKEIEDIRLQFENGKVISYEASKGEDLLKALLDTDEGARYVGEVAIGTNYGITNFTRNMLFDEKIGGTVHLAVGSTYPESGGKNESGIHWDMLCDMKSEGEIYADGELIFKNGEFTINL
ncbi:aminopeptidase [Natranaerobius trueperi]|uniref:Aminopeptidase n=1 Tax=Natranaerobius trueperi TaxID=759412 RepID=A0A226BUP3_9FIRM|nr:aminopeptidase [Natranaerobius trueperi]OWZ82758.1 aminopeptidase [Natranaerobius trueperi]